VVVWEEERIITTKNIQIARQGGCIVFITQKWKYDFIVQFLSGPLWKTSILDFVDYHCVVFDNEDENKF
jgi:hypothetical protein